MPIPDIDQPEILPVSDGLRLRKFDGRFNFAFQWYQDTETVYMVDGVRRRYTWGTLANMYRYLDRHGELYFIEAAQDGVFRPIGDVCFSQKDMPIVIGDARFRGRGVGRRVISALVQRGRTLGFDRLEVREIYEYNAASRKCFESVGFRVLGNL